MAIMAALALAAAASGGAMNDPYIWLEDPYDPKALAWVEAENARTLAILEKDPGYQALFDDALKIAEATDRVPTPDLIGGQVYNFWQDAAHVRGIWRATSSSGYAQPEVAWKPVLDLDALSTAEKANWVWKGSNCEPTRAQRCLLQLSDGGEDATTDREFDLKAGAFVQDGFVLPKSKQNVAWENKDTLLVARDWGAGTMTESGYPFVIKRVKRGEPLNVAKEVWRGQVTDVSAGPETFVDGEGRRAVVLSRGLDFYRNEFVLLTPAGLKSLALPAKSSIQRHGRGTIDRPRSGGLGRHADQGWNPCCRAARWRDGRQARPGDDFRAGRAPVDRW